MYRTSAGYSYGAIAALISLFFIFSTSIAGQSLADKHWHVTFETERFGPIEAIIEFKDRDDGLIGYDLSGSRKIISGLTGAAIQKAEMAEHLFSFSLIKDGDEYKGEMLEPWKNGKIALTATATGFKGRIQNGTFRGNFSGVPTVSVKKPLRNYSKVVTSFLKEVDQKVFDPKALKGAEWKKFSNSMKAIGSTAKDDLDILLGFRFAYNGKPFSHLSLGRSNTPSAKQMEQFDSYRVGGTPVTLDFDNDIAVLKIQTMMGVNTIEMIEEAFIKIGERSPHALIIDLRGNGGGAFAIKPLIEHIIDEPLDAGYFVTHKWNIENDRLPTQNELFAVEPWKGFSLKAWWGNIQSEKMIRLKFEPKKPNYDGQIFVLMDTNSQSATEMAIDALSTLESVTLIGEKTGGQVLSQSPFDVVGGFQTFIPVADYYSFTNGRLEGIGIKPDIETAPKDAMVEALRIAGTESK